MTHFWPLSGLTLPEGFISEDSGPRRPGKVFHFPESDTPLLMKGNTPLAEITDKDTPMPTAFSQTDWRHLSMR